MAILNAKKAEQNRCTRTAAPRFELDRAGSSDAGFPASARFRRRLVSWRFRPLMRTMHFITLFLVASCCAVLSVEPLAHVDAFSKLKQSDTLIVRYHTRGCFFHGATHEFTFRQASELTVSIVQLPRDAARAGIVSTQTNRVDLGTLTLSKSDVAGLDRLMEFYRSKHDSFCTTVDHLTFTQQRNGKTVATEQIEDRSPTYQTKRLTRFPELIGRLSSPKAMMTWPNP